MGGSSPGNYIKGHPRDSQVSRPRDSLQTRRAGNTHWGRGSPPHYTNRAQGKLLSYGRLQPLTHGAPSRCTLTEGGEGTSLLPWELQQRWWAGRRRSSNPIQPITAGAYHGGKNPVLYKTMQKGPAELRNGQQDLRLGFRKMLCIFLIKGQEPCNRVCVTTQDFSVTITELWTKRSPDSREIYSRVKGATQLHRSPASMNVPIHNTREGTFLKSSFLI